MTWDNKTKKCKACEIIKPLTEYYQANANTRVLRPECKECWREKVRAYRAKCRGLMFKRFTEVIQ